MYIQTSFRGRVFMTHPSKAIYKMLLSDYVKVSNIAIEEMLYDEQDLLRSMTKIEPINYHQEIEHNGIKFWCYNAGHVLGAAMFMVQIAGVKVSSVFFFFLYCCVSVSREGREGEEERRGINYVFTVVYTWIDVILGLCCVLCDVVCWCCVVFVLWLRVQILYTGDFSRQEDRHLMAAEIPHSMQWDNCLIRLLVFVCISFLFFFWCSVCCLPLFLFFPFFSPFFLFFRTFFSTHLSSFSLSNILSHFHLPPTVSPDILIVESTYGVQIHEPRAEREKRFTSIAHNIVQRGGRCLIPVFALGRAQELLLILGMVLFDYVSSLSVVVSLSSLLPLFLCLYFSLSLSSPCFFILLTYITIQSLTVTLALSLFTCVRVWCVVTCRWILGKAPKRAWQHSYLLR